MKPSTGDNYLGVEVEFITKKTQEQIRRFVLDNNLEYNIEVVGDGSIDAKLPMSDSVKTKYEILANRVDQIRYTLSYSTEDRRRRSALYENFERWNKTLRYYNARYRANGIEVRLLTSYTELDKNLKALDKVLQFSGGIVNKSCGLHVHLDMRNRDVVKCVERLHDYKDEIKKLVAAERLASTYCKFKSLRSDLAAIKNKSASRYRAFNAAAYRKHKTLEVRAHQGTINIKEILSWINYLTDIVDGKKAKYVKVG